MPLHILIRKIEHNLCNTLLKVYVLTEDDAVSKIGTKYSVLACEPLKYLADSGETSNRAI